MSKLSYSSTLFHMTSFYEYDIAISVGTLYSNLLGWDCVQNLSIDIETYHTWCATSGNFGQEVKIALSPHM